MAKKFPLLEFGEQLPIKPVSVFFCFLVKEEVLAETEAKSETKSKPQLSGANDSGGEVHVRSGTA